MIQTMLIICPIAGVGSRLFPITKNKPKAMLKVGGKRIIDHLMDKIRKTFPNGTKICFIVGYCKEQLMEYLKKIYKLQFELLFVEQKPMGFKNTYPFYSGLGDAIALAADYGREEDCFIILPDRFPLEDYSPMIQITNKKQLDGCINTQKVKEPQHYGIIIPNMDGIIEDIVEKPEKSLSRIAVSGAYYFRKNVSASIFAMLEEQSKKPITNYNEHHFTTIIQKLIIKGYKFGHNLMNRPVLDFGRPENLLRANKAIIDEFFETKTCIGHDSKTINSKIGDYATIGNNTLIKNCIIENCIIGDNCTLQNISLKNAIIDDNSTNENYRNNIIQL